MSTNLRPAAQLVLDSVRSAAGLSTRAVPSGYGSEELRLALRTAALHRVSPALVRYLKSQDALPADWGNLPEVLRHEQLMRHLRARQDLALIGQALDGAGLLWVSGKGPLAADTKWPRPDLREYFDLDVFIERRRFGSALEVLESVGCSYVDRNWPLLRSTERAEIAMLGPCGSPLDVHWDIAVAGSLRTDFRVQMPEMLARRERVTLGDGRQTWAFDAIDSLFHVAFHAAQAGVSKLVWPADVWFYARHLSTQQWQQFAARSRQARAELPIAMVIDDVVDLFDRPLGYDPSVLPETHRWWAGLGRHRRRRYPMPGLADDAHLGGTLQACARRSVALSLRRTVQVRWRLRHLEAGAGTETESQALRRDVPDSRARADYLELVERQE